MISICKTGGKMDVIKKAHVVKKKKNLAKFKLRQKNKTMKKIEEKNEKASFEIVFVGRSNVGKSTLLNTITKKKLRTGKRPGVTLQPTHLYFDDLLVTDMPGFGFMGGVTQEKTEEVKKTIVDYIEKHKDRIKVAVLVIDALSFEQIVDRWNARDEIPIDIEMYMFVTEFGINTIVAANKTDKISANELNDRMQSIKEKFTEIVNDLSSKRNEIQLVPISAKKEEIQPLVSSLRKELHTLKRNDLFKHILK